MYRRDIGRQWLQNSMYDDLELSLVTQPVLSEELEAYEVSTLSIHPRMTRRNAFGVLRQPRRQPTNYCFSTDAEIRPLALTSSQQFTIRIAPGCYLLGSRYWQASAWAKRICEGDKHGKPMYDDR